MDSRWMSPSSEGTLFMDLNVNGKKMIQIVDGTYKSYYLGGHYDKGVGAYSYADSGYMVWSSNDTVLTSGSGRTEGASLTYRQSNNYFYFWSSYKKITITKEMTTTYYVPYKGANFGYSDIFDFIPIVGAANRLVRGTVLAVAGQDCTEEFVLAGANALGDVIQLLLWVHRKLLVLQGKQL